jgi:hypothetical protein
MGHSIDRSDRKPAVPTAPRRAVEVASRQIADAAEKVGYPLG